LEGEMPWLMVIVGYLLGSIPTAYIAGHALKGVDIRRIGDDNMGAANAFRQLGAKIGLVVGAIDAGKGAVAILVAQATGTPQIAVFLTGAAAVTGHNWPVFLGFRGGRGESTTIGVLATLVTQPMIVVAVPAILVLAIKRNVVLASAFMFIPLPLVGWLLGFPLSLVAYSVALPCLVGFTHFLRARRSAVLQA